MLEFSEQVYSMNHTCAPAYGCIWDPPPHQGQIVPPLHLPEILPPLQQTWFDDPPYTKNFFDPLTSKLAKINGF